MASVVLSPLPSAPPVRGGRQLKRSGRAVGVTGAVAVHLILIIAVLQYTPARRSLATMTPVIVSLIAPAQPEAKAPPPKLPAVRKLRTREAPTPVETVVEPPPVTNTQSDQSPIFVPAPPAPAPATSAQAAVAPEPAPVVPPRFDADYLKNPAPPYPALARRMHEQGRVLVRVLVNIDGLAERIELKTSSGSTRLDQSALETIKNWKFIPARLGDQNVAAWVIVPIAFSLEG